MAFITEWVTNIILFILLASIIDMMLPSSKFQKYAKMVAGLLLITVILLPVFKLVSSNFEEVLATAQLQFPSEKNIDNSLELKKKEIQASFDEYTLSKMAVQLKGDVNEELITTYGMKIETIDIRINEQSSRGFPDNLTQVVIQMKEAEVPDRTIEVVKNVEIDTNQPLPSNQAPDPINTDSMISFLSEKWEVRRDVIVIAYEGGEYDKNG